MFAKIRGRISRATKTQYARRTVGKRVYITPASLDSQRGAPGPLPGNMVDFKVLETTIDADGFASGSALVLWQHSMLGEDQDQDMLNSIRWVTGGTAAEPTLTVYTQAVESNTGSAAQFGFGYTLVGTDKDGLHMHSGINKFLVVDPTGVSVAAGALYNGPEDATKCVTSNTVNEPKKLCSKLGAAGNVVRGETYKTFNMTGATNASLKEPLWYIAKYGGFSYTKNDKTAAATPVFTPTRYSQWDRRKSDGTICNDPTQPGARADGTLAEHRESAFRRDTARRRQAAHLRRTRHFAGPRAVVQWSCQCTDHCRPQRWRPCQPVFRRMKSVICR